MDSILTDYSRPLNDGPYIFYQGDSLLVLEVVSDSLIQHKIACFNDVEVPINSIGQNVRVSRNYSFQTKNTLQDVDKYLVISDLHGQFDLFCALLVNNEIVDQDLNWIWGNGQLIINGDVFDRGEKVTETLWLIYSLEQQAEKAGGKVRFLLGNHELMIFEKDLRYLHEKYIRTAQLMNIQAEDIHNENSVLGRWLRSKPACLKINDNLIVHAGISPELAREFTDLDTLNNHIYQTIYGKNPDESEIKLLTSSLGPFWYRGYFMDSSKYDLIEETQLDAILTLFDVKSIIVGHTSMDDIYYFFGRKLIAVDASMKLGLQAKGLLYDKNSFQTIDSSGKHSVLLKMTK